MMRKKGTNVIWKQLGEKLEVMLQLISHFASILIYFIPLVKFHPHHELVLDEVHVLSSSNKDVMGESSIRDVFMNDYWGRPMTNWDSHKSWRPISVLSFRMLYGGVLSSSVNPILVARMINVVIHAALGEMVSVLALMLFPQKEKTSNGQPLYAITLRTMTKLLFVLHPSHVEAVANAANRPHLLALMFTILTLDPSWHILLTAIFFASALLSCETAIFQVPSIIITLAAIHWKRKKKSDATEKFISLLLPRYFIVMMIALCYLFVRVLLGTTNIPDGLIRPAENPFYSLKGYKRVLSYSLVLSIHISKLFYTDFVGFSHEYGFNCVPQVSTLKDPRLILPLLVILGAITISLIVMIHVQQRRKINRNPRNLDPLFDLMVAYAWMGTLFPISGFIKVGTFIADRIVLPSTVMVSLFGGQFLTNCIFNLPTVPSRKFKAGHKINLIWKVFVLITLFVALSARCMRRTEKWMSSYELLKSSLVACPRSAKSNLELSKCYSGLFPDKQNFELALSYIEEAEKIDPEYCDVHWQMAQILFKRQQYIPFEERLTKAVLCPFTMGGAVSLYKQYWELAVMGSQNDHVTHSNILRRKEKYDDIIRKAIASETNVQSKDNLGTETENMGVIDANHHQNQRMEL